MIEFLKKKKRGKKEVIEFLKSVHSYREYVSFQISLEINFSNSSYMINFIFCLGRTEKILLTIWALTQVAL